MAKIGRNDPCPCGSGKKYKKCCLASDEAAARAAQSAAVPERRPALASYVQEHDQLDELTAASNAVVDMVQAGDLNAAEQAAHNTGDGQAGRRAESGDPSAPTHRGRERIGLGVGLTVSKRPEVALQVAGAEFATHNPRRVWPVSVILDQVSRSLR